MAIGAAILSGSLNYYFNENWNWYFTICLGLAVWIIYTFDHLIDAHKSEYEPVIARHKFHKKHKNTIRIFQIIAIVIGCISVLNLHHLTIYYGLGLLLIVIIYFIIVYFFRSFYLKEVMVAMVYALGIFLGPISLMDTPIDGQVINLFVQLFMIALLNLTLFSLMEYDLDCQDGHNSIATKFGKKHTTILILIIMVMLLTLQVFSIVVVENSMFQILFFIMSLTLSIIYLKSGYMIKYHRYRWLGDAVFFIPGIIFLF